MVNTCIDNIPKNFKWIILGVVLSTFIFFELYDWYSLKIATDNIQKCNSKHQYNTSSKLLRITILFSALGSIYSIYSKMKELQNSDNFHKQIGSPLFFSVFVSFFIISSLIAFQTRSNDYQRLKDNPDCWKQFTVKTSTFWRDNIYYHYSFLKGFLGILFIIIYLMTYYTKSELFISNCLKKQIKKNENKMKNSIRKTELLENELKQLRNS